MRIEIPLAAALVVAAATPAAAVTATFEALSGDISGTVVTAAPDLLEVDLELGSYADGRFIVTRTADDGDTLSFNAFVDFFASTGIEFLNVAVTPIADFAQIGDVEAAFSTATVVGEDSGVLITFDPNEFVSVTLGDVGFGGDDFLIDISAVGVGESFDIFFTAVPAPASLALFGLGALALGATRRRA